MTAIRLTKLQIDGPGKPSASVEFGTGLTAIVGASETGKSYIFHALDYLLGGSTPPSENPHSSGYNRGWLQFVVGDGEMLTIERVFSEDEVNVYNVDIARASTVEPTRRVRASHVTGSTESLSHILLEHIGLSGRQVRRNQAGAKVSVTFRHLAHATMVDEERIITSDSPALTGQFVWDSSDKGIFGLLLTGLDDSALTAVKVDKKTRDTALDAEIGLLKRLINDRQTRLRQLSDTPDQVEVQLGKISGEVEQASAVVSATRGRIIELEADRKQLWDEVQRSADRRLMLSEQLKRFRVLLEYYDSDRQRLSAVLEAGIAFEQLPSGACAVCGHMTSETETADLRRTLEAFRSACTAELEKIGILRADLQATIRDAETEHRKLGVRNTELEAERRKIDDQLQTELKPYRQSVDLNLGDLIRTKGNLSRAKDIQDELTSLQADLAATEAARAAKAPKSKAVQRVDTRVAQEFCQVVAETLRAWKYPLTGTVAFDPTKFDLVIGNQDRGSMGKGYRAITHAAFVISLMRYCRRKGLPHSGFVVIDTPLNPFRGASMSEGADAAINEEIKEAFYRDLGADVSGDQYIILENTEPPADLVPKIHYIQFTKNPQAGRYGFFPLS